MNSHDNELPNSETIAEVDRLMAALDRGDASPDEVDRLQLLVRTVDEARDRYVRGMMLKASLEWENIGSTLVQGVLKHDTNFRATPKDNATRSVLGNNLEEGAKSRLPIVPAPALGDNMLTPPDTIMIPPADGNSSPTSVLGFISQGFSWFSRPVSLIVLILAGLGAWGAISFVNRVPHEGGIQGGIAGNQSGNEGAEAGIVEKIPSSAVARVTGTWDAIWSSPEGSRKSGDLLPPGARLELTGGLAEVTFECGAVVILQSPSSFVIENAHGASLESGRLTARVPGPSAKFWVNTRSMKVLDLGTEFGLSAESSGAAQVRVFEGAVEVEPTSPAADSSNARRLITAGQIGRVEPAGGFSNQPPVAEPSSAYVRAMPNNFDEDYTRTILSSRPWGYWSFNSVITSTLVPDISGHGRFGQLYGNAMVVQGGNILAIGQAAAIGGEGDSVMVPTGSVLSLRGDFTMEVLFRTTGNGGVLMSKVPADGTWKPGSKILFVRGGEVRFTPCSSKPNPYRMMSAKVFVNDNQWHHAVLTNKADVSGNRDTTVLYIDGVERARRTDWDITADSDEKYPLRLGVGCLNYPTKNLRKDTHFPNRTHLTGHIDEVAVFDRCFDADEVEQHYRAYLTAGIARRNMLPFGDNGSKLQSPEEDEEEPDAEDITALE